MTTRPIAVVLLSLLSVLCASRPAQAQNAVGASLGYLYDSPDDYWVLTASGWIPFDGPDKIVFKPLVLSPRFEMYFGLEGYQGDVNALWDIPLSITTNIHPYIGMGGGVQHFPDETKPVLNFVTGLRYKKPEWRYHFVLESVYSSGINNSNTMVMSLGMLFDFGGK